MSLEVILAAIEGSGEAEVSRLRAETEARVRQVLTDAEVQASARREAVRREAMHPVAGERARRLHQAKLEALHTVGEIRDGLIAAVLEKVRSRLIGLRADPEYAVILHRLVEEAIAALGEETQNGQRCSLEADPRDVELVGRILSDLGFTLTVIPALNTWGGVVVSSHDGRVVVTNTLEARLERAAPFLRRHLATIFEKETQEQTQIGAEVVPG